MQTLKNVTFSFMFLFGSRKLVDLLNSRFCWRYPRISNYILPLGYIYGLSMSNTYMQLASDISAPNFLVYLLKTYTFYYQLSYTFSLITFLVGYPTINILSHMGANYARLFINKHETLVNQIIRVAYQMMDCLEKNKNWDIVFHNISFKTWSTPQPIVNEESLEKVAPLRRLLNHSVSEFLEEKCSICQEKMETKKLHRELPCKHVFHPECIDGWLLKCNATCPICRKSIYE